MLQTLNDTAWFALGVAATLVGAFVAHRIGRIQISFMRQAHDLTVKLAKCQIGSTCKIALRIHNVSGPDVSRYIVTTSIHNAGELAARDIKGKWDLSSSEQSYDCSRPIRIDFVCKGAPYELESYTFHSEAITQAILSGKAWIKVDIELEFSGLDGQTPERYSAKYDYSHQQKQMVRIN
jgi:hypothetical protein